jgi:signal transduction histidine kinase
MIKTAQRKIFDPFFTLKSGGTGLGLAIVYRIIENHLGEIEVTSEVGKGTRFGISLPYKQI